MMGTQAVSVYQQVIEKTKGLSFRSQMLAMNLEKKLGIKDNVSNTFLSSKYPDHCFKPTPIKNNPN